MSQPNVRTTCPYASFSKNFIHSAPGSEFDNMFFYGPFFSSHQTILKRKKGGGCLTTPICILTNGQIELLTLSLNTHTGSRSRTRARRPSSKALPRLCRQNPTPFFKAHPNVSACVWSAIIITPVKNNTAPLTV